jgi:O-antigen ligase
MELRRNLLLAMLVISGGAILISTFSRLPLELTLLGVTSLVLALYLAARSPIWFLVAAIFAPQWKTIWFFQSLNRVADLTLVILLCLMFGLAWRLMKWRGGPGHMEFRSLFLGQSSQILAFLVFAALVAASYSYTSAPDYGGSKLLRFLLIGTLLLITPFLIILSEDDFLKFAKLFLGFCTVTSIQVIANLVTRNQNTDADITRIGAGWLMGMAIVILLFYPVARTRGRQRKVIIFLLPVFIGGLMAAAARGPIVGLSIASLIGMAILLKERQLRIVTAATMLLVLALGFGGAYFILRQTDAGKYAAKTGEIESLFTEGTSSGSAGERLGFYKATIAAIPNQPLWGTGIGSWSTFYFGDDQRNYPHNLFLEIAFEEGLIGLAAFLALLAMVGISIYRMIGNSSSHFLVLGLLVLYSVINSMFSGDLDDNRMLWMWIGVALSVCRLVQVRISAFRSLRETARRSPYADAPPANIPSFSRTHS